MREKKLSRNKIKEHIFGRFLACVNEGRKERKKKRKKDRQKERKKKMKERKNEPTKERTNAQTNERMDGQTGGRMDDRKLADSNCRRKLFCLSK